MTPRSLPPALQEHCQTIEAAFLAQPERDFRPRWYFRLLHYLPEQEHPPVLHTALDLLEARRQDRYHEAVTAARCYLPEQHLAAFRRWYLDLVARSESGPKALDALRTLAWRLPLSAEEFRSVQDLINLHPDPLHRELFLHWYKPQVPPMAAQLRCELILDLLRLSGEPPRTKAQHVCSLLDPFAEGRRAVHPELLGPLFRLGWCQALAVSSDEERYRLLSTLASGVPEDTAPDFFSDYLLMLREEIPASRWWWFLVRCLGRLPAALLHDNLDLLGGIWQRVPEIPGRGELRARLLAGLVGREAGAEQALEALVERCASGEGRAEDWQALCALVEHLDAAAIERLLPAAPAEARHGSQWLHTLHTQSMSPALRELLVRNGGLYPLAQREACREDYLSGPARRWPGLTAQSRELLAAWGVALYRGCQNLTPVDLA